MNTERSEPRAFFWVRIGDVLTIAQHANAEWIIFGFDKPVCADLFDVGPRIFPPIGENRVSRPATGATPHTRDQE